MFWAFCFILISSNGVFSPGHTLPGISLAQDVLIIQFSFSLYEYLWHGPESRQKSDYCHGPVWPMRNTAKPVCTPPARRSSFNYLICDTNRCLCCIIKNSQQQQQWQTTMKSRKWKVISRRAHAINKVSHLPCELPAQSGEPKAEVDTHLYTHTHWHNEMGPVTVVWKYNTHNFHFLRPKKQKQKRSKLTKPRQNMAQCGVPERGGCGRGDEGAAGT